MNLLFQQDCRMNGLENVSMMCQYLSMYRIAGTFLGVQALGIALKLTFQGENQFVFIETYFCILVRSVPMLQQCVDMALVEYMLLLQLYVAISILPPGCR